MQYVKIKFYFLGLDGFIFYLDKHFHHHDKLQFDPFFSGIYQYEVGKHFLLAKFLDLNH